MRWDTCLHLMRTAILRRHRPMAAKGASLVFAFLDLCSRQLRRLHNRRHVMRSRCGEAVPLGGRGPRTARCRRGKAAPFPSYVVHLHSSLSENPISDPVVGCGPLARITPRHFISLSGANVSNGASEPGIELPAQNINCGFWLIRYMVLMRYN